MESSKEKEEESDGRYVVHLVTSTSTLTSTVISTVVANGYETLRFTSDAADPGCLPLAFLAANDISEC